MTDFVYTIKAHPTTYAGVNFRSRLEATWAAFFDLCGWEWQYEPIDLEGWVPDFVLERRVAVEVKPIFELSDLPEEYLTRLKSSGWAGPIWVFGATVETKMTSQIGWHISGTGSFWPSRDHKLEGGG